MPYNRGDVVLIPFPFTDLTGRKKRPGVVVSADSYNSRQNDLILAQVSSEIRVPLPSDEHLIADWNGCGLLFPSVIRPKLFTLEESIVIRSLGRIPSAEMNQLDQKLRTVLAL